MRGGMMGENMQDMKRFRERAGASGKGPEFSKIAGETDRNETEKLVDSLIGRFFCVEIPAKARASFIEYAESKKGVSFTDEELGELCHLMLSTPHYQLT